MMEVPKPKEKGKGEEEVEEIEDLEELKKQLASLKSIEDIRAVYYFCRVIFLERTFPPTFNFTK